MRRTEINYEGYEITIYGGGTAIYVTHAENDLHYFLQGDEASEWCDEQEGAADLLSFHEKRMADYGTRISEDL